MTKELFKNKELNIEKNKGICRVDQKVRKSHGWYCRVRFEGKVFSKFFSDKKHGGRYSALLSSITWRDDQESKLGIVRTDKVIVTKAKSNTGIPGLTYNAVKNCLEAYWVTPTGKVQKATRSLNTNDKEQVIEELIQLREQKERVRLLGEQEAPIVKAKKTDLFFGPYKAPSLEVGDEIYCKARKRKVKVSGFTKGKIPWPTVGGNGHPCLILCGDLAKAIKQESGIAITKWFGASERVVSAWRRTLGVSRFNAGTKKITQKYCLSHNS